jgi:2-keto-3-deoxy-L-rhamnonate aldolase RhmA
MYWENSAFKIWSANQKKATANIDKVLAGPGVEIIFIGSIFIPVLLVTMLKH